MKNTLLCNEDELFQYLADLVNSMSLGNLFFFILVVYDKGTLNYISPKVSFRRLLLLSVYCLEI